MTAIESPYARDGVTLDTAQTITARKTFTATGSGSTGAIITDDITVQPNSGVSASASMFLDNTAGEVWEFFCSGAGAFGVFDKTNSATILSIAPTLDVTFTPARDFVLSSGNLRCGVLANFQKGIQNQRTTVNHGASPYSVSSTADYILGCDTSGGAITANLPNIGWAAQTYIVKDESGNAGANNITVAGSGGQLIDGASTKVISSAYGVLRVYSTGSGWATW